MRTLLIVIALFIALDFAVYARLVSRNLSAREIFVGGGEWIALPLLGCLVLVVAALMAGA